MTQHFTVLGPIPRRSYRVTLGLLPGYSPTNQATEMQIGLAAEVLAAWMKARAERGEFVPRGVLARGEAVYTRPREDFAGHQAFVETVVVFAGEVSPAYAPEVADEVVAAALNDLASAMAVYLEQTRVYVAWMDQVWVVQRTETPPTGASP